MNRKIRVTSVLGFDLKKTLIKLGKRYKILQVLYNGRHYVIIYKLKWWLLIDKESE